MQSQTQNKNDADLLPDQVVEKSLGSRELRFKIANRLTCFCN